MTKPKSAFPQALLVQALPWPMVELLTVALRKLSHDLRNDFTTIESMLDLTVLRNQDAGVAERLQRLRHHASKPQATVTTAVGAVPGLGDRPRTLAALQKSLRSAAEGQGVDLHWQAPEDARDLAPGPTEAEWCHVAHTLVQNALEAHAAAELDEGPGLPRSIEVDWRGPTLDVRDDGPGCGDLNAAAHAGLRRAGHGHMGLGLAVAAALVGRHAGTLRIGPADSGGFRALVQLGP